MAGKRIRITIDYPDNGFEGFNFDGEPLEDAEAAAKLQPYFESAFEGANVCVIVGDLTSD